MKWKCHCDDISSLVALKVIILTTSMVANDENFAKMEPCPFKWWWCDGRGWNWPYTTSIGPVTAQVLILKWFQQTSMLYLDMLYPYFFIYYDIQNWAFRDSFHKILMSSWLNSCENRFCSDDMIMPQFCTCHDSSAVVTCAKVGPDLIISFHQQYLLYTRLEW